MAKKAEDTITQEECVGDLSDIPSEFEDSEKDCEWYEKIDEKVLQGLTYSSRIYKWFLPFIMSTVNTQKICRKPNCRISKKPKCTMDYTELLSCTQKTIKWSKKVTLYLLCFI